MHDINMQILQLHRYVVQCVYSTSFSFQYLFNKKQKITLFRHPYIFIAEGQHNEITMFLCKF